MKRFLKVLQPHMVRPIVQSAVTKVVIGAAVLLGWHFFVNAKSAVPRGIVDTGCFFLAVYFIVWAWFQYLAFDGVRPLQGLFHRESMETSDDLEDEEKIASRLCSNLMVGILFLIIWAVGSV